MTEARSEHRLGIALVVAAAIAWSTAPLFTRLLPYDSWTILFWRGLFGGGLIVALMGPQFPSPMFSRLIAKTPPTIKSPSSSSAVIPPYAFHFRLSSGNDQRALMAPLSQSRPTYS